VKLLETSYMVVFLMNATTAKTWQRDWYSFFETKRRFKTFASLFLL